MDHMPRPCGSSGRNNDPQRTDDMTSKSLIHVNGISNEVLRPVGGLRD